MWNDEEPGKFVFSATKLSATLRWEDVTPLDAKELLQALGDPIKPYMLRHLKISAQDYEYLEQLRTQLRAIFEGEQSPLGGNIADQVIPLEKSESPLIQSMATIFINKCHYINERKAGFGTGGVFPHLY
jgi:hypothetical protein